MTYCYDDDYNYYYNINSAEAQSRRPIISLNQQNNDHNAALLGVKCVQNADRVRPVGESLMLLLFRGNSANSSAMRAGGGARFMLCTTPVTQLTRSLSQFVASRKHRDAPAVRCRDLNGRLLVNSVPATIQRMWGKCLGKLFLLS